MSIASKTIVVTGGASGLGLAIANSLQLQGAKVIVIDIDPGALNALDDVKFTTYPCDITNDEQLQQTYSDIVETDGPPDVLINNAGILHSEPMFNFFNADKKHSIQNWQKVIDINLTAPFRLCSLFVEALLSQRKKGLVINISSISALGNPGQAAYSAAKAGLESFTKVCGKELGPMGIRSVAIAPGFINTPSTADAITAKKLDDIRSSTPTKRLGEVTEITSVVDMIINNEHINATVLHIDGGLVV